MTTAHQDGARLINEAVEAFKARDRDTTADKLARAIKADPPIGTKWASVSRLAATMGEVSIALTAANASGAKQVATAAAADAKTAAELVGFLPEPVIGERLHIGLERIDLRDDLVKRFDVAIVGRAEDGLHHGLEHGNRGLAIMELCCAAP